MKTTKKDMEDFLALKIICVFDLLKVFPKDMIKGFMRYNVNRIEFNLDNVCHTWKRIAFDQWIKE